MRTLKGFLYLILGGTLCGWMFNRIAAWFIDNPLTVGSNHTVAEWAVILQDPFYLDSRTMPFFFLAFGALALVTMTKYDWTGEREEQKKLRGEEYGNQRWARDDEMQQFAHTSTVKRVPIRIPQRTADAMRFARNNPKDFIKARLGMTNKVANPKPDYVEKIEDDNIILSERAELQMSKIPDPALERNKHVYVLGGSGSGKTFNFVGPNLLQLNSSIVTTDPKGDTLKQYGNFFLRHGYKLKVVNTKPDQINLSMHYNPLLYLQDSTSIMQIVNLLVENTSGNAEAEKEDFFVKAERQLYMALMGYLFYFYADQPQYQTFPQMLDLLQLAGKDNPSQTKTPLDIIMLGTTAEDGFQGFEEWIVANHGGDEAAAQASEEYFVIKQYKGFKSTSGSPETEASVIASCNVRLAPFAVSAVREFFSEDELELEMIGEERTAFFLVMSDTDKTFNFILAMLLYQLFDVNTAIADRNPGSHCKIPINCILDELANIGRIPDSINRENVDALDAPKVEFTAAVTGMVNSGDKMAPERIVLCRGARVMSLVNSPQEGYVNGTQGTVTDASADAVTVKFDGADEKVRIERHRWEINKSEAVVEMDEEGRPVNRVKTAVVGAYTQIPLKLAYAITIHKSQGLTFDACCVHTKVFAEGQLYVGLSRVRSAAGLTVFPKIEPNRLIASREVVEFYDSLEHRMEEPVQIECPRRYESRVRAYVRDLMDGRDPDAPTPPALEGALESSKGGTPEPGTERPARTLEEKIGADIVARATFALKFAVSSAMSKDHLEAKMLLAGYVLDWGRAPHELYVVCKEGGYRVSASELGIRRSEIEARIAKNSGFDLGSARRQPSPSDSRPGKRKGSAKESAGRTRNTRKANKR